MWSELARFQSDGSDTTLDTDVFSTKPYLMVLEYDVLDAVGRCKLQVGNTTIDDDTNYTARRNRNGGSELLEVGSTWLELSNDGTWDSEMFKVTHIYNNASYEKLAVGRGVNRGLVGQEVPNRSEFAGKWDQTASQIDRLESKIQGNTATLYESDSEIVVLGFDPNDTASTGSFWEELATVTTSGDETTISSGTITAKKYLYVEALLTGDYNSGTRPRFRFNNSAASIYCNRLSNNGATDESNTAYESGYISESDMCVGFWGSCFILNVAGQEKLCIASSGRAPNLAVIQEFEGVFKWVETTNPITEIDLIGSNYDPPTSTFRFSANSTLRVWGSD